MAHVGKPKICIIGVGYVGEHLLTSFGKSFDVVGVDISYERIQLLRQRYRGLLLSTSLDSINANAYDVFLISVPTLLNANKKVDTKPLDSVKKSLEGKLKKGSFIHSFIVTPVAPVHNCNRACLFSSPLCTALRTTAGSIVVVESSVTVGCTRKLFGDLASKGIHIGFSPERTIFSIDARHSQNYIRD